MSGPKDGDIEPVYAEVGRKIARLRRKVGMTQVALSVNSGLARTSIASIESGEQRFLLHHLFAIAAALGVTASRLLPQEPRGMEQIVETALAEIGTEDPQAAKMIRDVLNKVEPRK